MRDDAWRALLVVAALCGVAGLMLVIEAEVNVPLPHWRRSRRRIVGWRYFYCAAAAVLAALLVRFL